MSELRVAIVEYDIQFENKRANFSKVTEATRGLEADLVVLPETFQTGFCVADTWMAEDMEGETMQFLHNLSKELDAVICGTFLCMDGRDCMNRFVAVEGDDVICIYDKIHLFRMQNEDKFVAAGSVVKQFNVKGFEIRPVICYDIRFPYISFNNSSYDVLVCPANWPSQRINHWDVLLQARSIENQAYVVGANRIGECQGHFFPGHSSIYDPAGHRVAFSYKKDVIQYTLRKDVIEKTREQLPFLVDQVTI